MPRTEELQPPNRTVVDRKTRVDADRQLELFHSRLKDRGLKSTGQRDDIARVFFGIGQHISAERLYAEVKKINPHVGYATIYRTLRLLKECELVSERHFDDGQARFEVVSDKHHDHFICERCGKIIEFENDRIESLQDAVARKHGFTVVHHKLELYGRCAECAAR